MAKTPIQDKSLYFQFRPGLGYPVFLKFENQILVNNIGPLAQQIGFEKLAPEKNHELPFSKGKTKVLQISQASSKVLQSIGEEMGELGDLGPESIRPQNGYELYRMKGVGLMVFARETVFWELGLAPWILQDLGKSPAFEFHLRMVLHRFLALALEPLGVVSFWGHSADAGVVVTKSFESEGRAVYFDCEKQKFFSSEGIKELTQIYKIIRLDSTLKEASRRMKTEDLLAFLLANHTYFSYGPLPGKLRHSIVFLANHLTGSLFYLQEKSFPKIAPSL